MVEKKYLIWIDILGFDKLPKEIAEKRGRTARRVRDDFINVIKEGVAAVEDRKEIIGKKYGEDDEWLLVTNSVDSVFKVIYEILHHNTEYRNYEKIPLEIAVGIGEYDRWAKFDGSKLVIEDSTIEFLKTNIIGYFHEWYKQNQANEHLMSTFILLTESAYDELEPLDKQTCQEIEHKHKKDDGKEEVITFYVADVDKVQQRGRMFEFLKKIKELGSKLYDRIECLYVLPLEYEEIKKALKTDRIVFITGTAEYGKTYTAVRLLWEYFCKGYEPIWMKGGEAWERMETRKKLEEIERELRPHRVIYFEDPFGKTRYESREGLEREIGTIIHCIRKVEDVYVIITSREGVFREFGKEQLSSEKIKKFEKKLNIKSPSYSYQKRKEILLGWAKSKGCKWFEIKDYRDFMSEQIRDKRKLPTPLSIKDFVYSTLNTREERTLMRMIKAKSKETARSFAEEIENMTYDKIVFLSFPFISAFRIDFAREEYEKLVRELKIKEPWKFPEKPSKFVEILGWFKDDQIAVTQGKIKFSHPSYNEAVKHLLVKGRQMTWINEDIFSKVLLKLVERDEAAVAVARIVERYFLRLPEDVRNKLLLKLVEKDRVAKVLARCAYHFGRLPEDVRNELLVKLAEKDKSAWEVALAVDNFSDLIPEDVRNELLLKLARSLKDPWLVARYVAHYFGRLPEDVRNLLVRFAESDRAAREAVGWAVADYFNCLPEHVRNKLLLKLIERDEGAVPWPVAWAMVHYFGRLPEDVRNKLLCKLQHHFHFRRVLIHVMSAEYRRMEALELISKAKSKIDKEVAFDVLNRLIMDKNEEVRRKAQELMISIKES